MYKGALLLYEPGPGATRRPGQRGGVGLRRWSSSRTWRLASNLRFLVHQCQQVSGIHHALELGRTDNRILAPPGRAVRLSEGSHKGCREEWSLVFNTCCPSEMVCVSREADSTGESSDLVLIQYS